jgi:MFS transporter, OFA family, oxalate/formate antiporter
VALPLIAQVAMLHDGWRAGWLAVGAAVLAIGFVPNWLLMVRRPEDVGLAPDRRSMHDAPPAVRATEPVFSRAQALRTRSYWLLCLFALFAYPVQAGVSLHQAPFLIERGLSPTVAAAIVSAFSLMSGVASLACGFVPRSMPIRYALALSGAAISVGTLVMLGVASALQGFIAAAIFGAGIGGLLTLLPIVFADYYGRSSYGAIRGIALWPRPPARCCRVSCATGRVAMISRCDASSCCPVSASWRRCSRVNLASADWCQSRRTANWPSSTKSATGSPTSR